MTLFVIAVLAIAALDWTAVAKGWKKIEYFAKPATMVMLFVTLAVAGGFGAIGLICIGLGIIFSLAGDIFIMLSNRWFIAGLGAFLLAHVSYIIGLNSPIGECESFMGNHYRHHSGVGDRPDPATHPSRVARKRAGKTGRTGDGIRNGDNDSCCFRPS